MLFQFKTVQPPSPLQESAIKKLELETIYNTTSKAQEQELEKSLLQKSQLQQSQSMQNSQRNMQKLEFKFKLINQTNTNQEQLQQNKKNYLKQKILEDLQLIKEKNESDPNNVYLQHEHECQPKLCDDGMIFCKKCLKCLNSDFYGTSLKINEPYTISYNRYKHIFQYFKDQRSILIVQNMNYITGLIQLREFIYIILNRQDGQGFQEILQNLNIQIPSHLFFCTPIYDQIQDNEIQLFGDYESANLGSFFWSGNDVYMNNYNYFLFLKIKSCNICIQQYFGCSHIVLKSDTNSKGYTQWFNFGVNFKGNNKREIRFIILNNRKSESAFQYGMKITQLEIDNQNKSIYRQVGEDISYEPNNFLQNPKNSKSYLMEEEIKMSKSTKRFIGNFFSLQFSYLFIPNSPKFLFQYTYQYTFSELIHFLSETEIKLKQCSSAQYSFEPKTKKVQIITKKIQYNKEIIGNTRLGLPLYKIQISHPEKILDKRQKTKILNINQRKTIYIIARQHPGETAGSYIAQGILKLLTDPKSQLALKILEYFIFEIIPMCNPDGVVVGNNRCNISGFDMNRRWNNPDSTLDPEIYSIKSYINVKYYIQFHSNIYVWQEIRIQYNSFLIYMVIQKNMEPFCIQMNQQKTIIHLTGQAKDYFKRLWKISVNHMRSLTLNKKYIQIQFYINNLQITYFDTHSCSYDISEKKTARYVAWKYLQVQFSFTLETSLYGYQNKEQGQLKTNRFTSENYEEIGQHLIKSILVFTFVREVMRAEAAMNDGELVVSSTNRYVTILLKKQLKYYSNKVFLNQSVTYKQQLASQPPEREKQKNQEKINVNQTQTHAINNLNKKYYMNQNFVANSDNHQNLGPWHDKDDNISEDGIPSNYIPYDERSQIRSHRKLNTNKIYTI